MCRKTFFFYKLACFELWKVEKPCSSDSPVENYCCRCWYYYVVPPNIYKFDKAGQIMLSNYYSFELWKVEKPCSSDSLVENHCCRGWYYYANTTNLIFSDKVSCIRTTRVEYKSVVNFNKISLSSFFAQRLYSKLFVLIVFVITFLAKENSQKDAYKFLVELTAGTLFSKKNSLN